MKAYAVLEGTKEITEITLPTPAPVGAEVVLRVLYSGVCHSDTHLLEGGYDLGTRGMMLLKDRGVPYPLVLGHEVVGVVESVGPEASADLVGKMLLVFPWIGCGECSTCRSGRDNACTKGRMLGVQRHGGYAEYISVPHEKYLIDIGGLDPAWAATLACSGLTSYSAVNKVRHVDPEEPVVVIGAGGLGLTAVAMLRARGHRHTIAVDLSERNLKLALEMGAGKTVLADPASLAADIVAAAGEPVAAVIDFVNGTSTAIHAFDALRKGGLLVHVGLFGGEMTIPTALLPVKMLTLQGSYVGTLAELQELVGMAKTNNLPRIPLIRGTLNAAGVADSLAQLVQRKVAGRIVLSADRTVAG
ncbi:alcohol dehydrogenase [Streptomyces albogriseolus]|uniref:alcohol dehydrogenase n=1 Tax=Streptomyces albogriseolus TaxID=1887 RepID=UPI0019A8E982|nr:alcohol dehydrogenase catalytic domain-containing protein [Streptomyces sp.]